MLRPWNDLIAALFEPNSEDLSILVLGRFELGVDFDHAVRAATLRLQNLERRWLISGRNDAVRNLALKNIRGWDIHDIAQGRPITEGTEPIRAAGTSIRRG